MKKLVFLYGILITLVFILSSCSNNGIVDADDVREALQKQGLDVEQLTLETAKQLASTSIDINGAVPVPFELTLPAGDMAHREFLFAYVFRSEAERIRIDESDGSPSPIKLGDLYPNVIRTKNVLAIYWSNNKEKPLLMKQFSDAMKKL